jgi:hypothetical protein
MENILKLSNANEVSDNIRQEINSQFESEKYIDLKSWNNEVEILDSIAESERLRNNLTDYDNEFNSEAPKLKIKNRNKKKKRFLFF